MKKILVIGSSGMLGSPVTLELIRAGFDVSLAGRDTEKLQKLFPNIPVHAADVFNPDSLEEALDGKDIVYLNLSVNPSTKESHPQTEREGVRNIIQAAKNKGVKRIGYLSSLIKNYEGMNGFSWWAFKIKHGAIEAIKSSGLNYSIFYPSTFMETLDKQMMQGNRIMMAGNSEAPMWFIAAKDYGEQVAWAFKKSGDENNEYSVQGLNPYTFDEAVKIFCENYQSKVKTVKTPLLPLKLAGYLNQKFNYVYHICEALNKYPEKFESEKTWNDLGKPSITLADYASSLKPGNPK